jgi:uncharacterized protein HemY
LVCLVNKYILYNQSQSKALKTRKALFYQIFMGDVGLAVSDNTDTYISIIGTLLMVLIVVVFISILLVVITRFFS